MRDWLGHYGGFVLIVAGWLLLTGLIPSAAGPAEAVRGEPPVVPVTSPPAGGEAVPPRLIANSWRGSLTSLGNREPGATLAGRAATAIPPPPYPVATPEPPPAVTPGPEAASGVPMAPVELPVPAPLAPPTDRIVIPRIGVDTAVVDVGILESGEMETAAFAAGRLAFGAHAGEAGNTVIAGHNDVQGEVFRRLPELRTGDEIILYRGEAAHRYRVELRTIVREDGATDSQRLENARWMDATDESTCTLISCYPYRVDTHRIIVRARLNDRP